MFPWKKYLISLKAPELCRKTYFQIKVNKSGKCHYLGPGWVPWGNFRGNRSCWGSIFMLFPYFVYIAHFPKFTRGSSSFMENLCSWKNKQRKKVLGRKKGKKGRPKEERKSTTLSSKEQNSFVKAISTNGASRWRPDFEQRERHLTNFCHTWC